MAKVKGSALIPRLKYIEENGNTAEKDQIINRLDNAFQDDCKTGLLMGHWYPFNYYTDLNNAIDKIMGNGDLKLIPLLGRYSAEQSLKGVYKFFYKIGSPEFVIKMAGRVWEQYFLNGKFKVDVIHSGKIVIAMSDFEVASREHCQSVVGWAQRTIELSGGKNVSYKEVKCCHKGNEHCEFEITWE